MPSEPTPAQLAALVRAALPERRDLAVVSVVSLGGYQHELWRLTVRWAGGSARLWTPPQTEELVLRLFRSPLTWWRTADPDKPTRELRLTPHLLAAGLPVPAVLAAGDDADLGPYSVLRVAPGQPWFHPEVDIRGVLTPLIAPHAANLARLHAMAPESVADVPLPGSSVVGALERYRSLAKTAGAPEVVAMAARLTDLASARAELPAVLVNGNPDFGNVLVGADGALAAWLDWEDAALADPRWDVAAVVAYLRVFALADLGQRFVEAYQAAAGRTLPDLTLWLAIVALRGWATTVWLQAERTAGRAIPFPGLDHWLFSLPRYRGAAQTALQRAEGWFRLQQQQGGQA